MEATLACVLVFHTLFESLGRPLALMGFGLQRADLFGTRLLGLLLYGITGLILWAWNLKWIRQVRCE